VARHTFPHARTAVAAGVLAATVAGLSACTTPRPTPLDPHAIAATTQPPGARGAEPTPSAAGASTSPEASQPAGAPGDELPDPAFPIDSGEYAGAAVQAWAAGNTERLDELEMAGGLLHTTPAAAGFSLAYCDGLGAATCLFVNAAGDELALPVRSGGGARAVGAGGTLQRTTFPSDDRAYAQQTLTAWQHRNSPRLKLLTRQNLDYATMDSLGARWTGTWSFDGGEGGAGSVYLTWRDGAGHALTFRFSNGPPAPTTGEASLHRVTEVMYEP
jgi:hypothetical protein